MLEKNDELENIMYSLIVFEIFSSVVVFGFVYDTRINTKYRAASAVIGILLNLCISIPSLVLLSNLMRQTEDYNAFISIAGPEIELKHEQLVSCVGEEQMSKVIGNVYKTKEYSPFQQ